VMLPFFFDGISQSLPLKCGSKLQTPHKCRSCYAHQPWTVQLCKYPHMIRQLTNVVAMENVEFGFPLLFPSLVVLRYLLAHDNLQ
jgi:hypothetical protein